MGAGGDSGSAGSIRPRALARSGVFESGKNFCRLLSLRPLRERLLSPEPPPERTLALFSLSFCSLFAFFIFVPFFLPFYLPKVAPGLQNPSQKRPKTVPETLQKSIQKIASFLNRFLTFVLSFLVQKIKSKTFKNQWEIVLLEKAEHPRNTVKRISKSTFS